MKHGKKFLFTIPATLLGLVLVTPVFAQSGSGNQPGSGAASQSQPPSDPPAVGADPSTAARAGKPSRARAEDGVITTKVKSALFADDEVKGTGISVETRDGEVVLGGRLDNQRQIERALEIAKTVDGVKKVNNKLSLKAKVERQG